MAELNQNMRECHKNLWFCYCFCFCFLQSAWLCTNARLVLTFQITFSLLLKKCLQWLILFVSIVVILHTYCKKYRSFTVLIINQWWEVSKNSMPISSHPCLPKNHIGNFTGICFLSLNCELCTSILIISYQQPQVLFPQRIDSSFLFCLFDFEDLWVQSVS